MWEPATALVEKEAVMGLIANLNKLKKLLNGQNLKYLDCVLMQLTNPQSRTFHTFWVEFRGKFPEQVHADTAYTKLKELHMVVKDQLREGGV